MQRVFRYNIKSTFHEVSIAKLGFIKIKNFDYVKGIVHKLEKKSQTREEFSKQISDKVPVPKIYK